MWEYVKLPGETDDPGESEKLIEKFAVEKMREYDGTVFSVSPAQTGSASSPSARRPGPCITQPKMGGPSVRHIRLRNW